MVEQRRPSRLGVTLRVGAFAFLAYTSLVILSYGPMLFQLIRDAENWSRGIRVW